MFGISLAPDTGASRFRSSAGLYFYGKVRRTDWLPVGAEKPGQETRRSAASVSSESANESVRESDDCADERSDSESSDSSIALGEDPADLSSDDECHHDIDDDNYLDREGDRVSDEDNDLFFTMREDSDSDV